MFANTVSGSSSLSLCTSTVTVRGLPLLIRLKSKIDIMVKAVELLSFSVSILKKRTTWCFKGYKSILILVALPCVEKLTQRLKLVDSRNFDLTG